MSRIEQWMRPNIRSLVPYSSAKDEFSEREAIFLDANENPFGTFNRYPDPQQRLLKTALTKRKSLTTGHVFVGNGSDEIIDVLLRIFCTPGRDKIATFTPTYGMYKVSADIHDISVVSVPLDENLDIVHVDFQPFLNDSEIKVLFLCSPNNPTGNNLNRERMIALIEQFEGIVCIDEAYIEFSDQQSLVNLIHTYDNLVVTRTLSKARGLAGARIGYAFANTEIINVFNKVKPPYNISSLNQQIALKTLENNPAFERQLALLREGREALITALQKLPIVQYIYPTAANFILIKVLNANRVYEQLRKQKIIVRNRSSQIPNALRISVGTPEENQQLLNALTTLL